MRRQLAGILKYFDDNEVLLTKMYEKKLDATPWGGGNFIITNVLRQCSDWPSVKSRFHRSFKKL